MDNQHELGFFQPNQFGEPYLYAVNRGTFESSESRFVYRQHFGDSIFKEDTFYIIAGTDSGLLLRHIIDHGVPRSSRYLFVEIPEIIEALNVILCDADVDESQIAIATPEEWQQVADSLDMERYLFLDRCKLIQSLAAVHCYFPAYRQLWAKIKAEYGYNLWNAQTVFTFSEHTTRQLENLAENRIPAAVLESAYEGLTGVILAGGPSLDMVIPWVLQNRARLVVFAVSRVSNQLLSQGINPDFIFSIDPLDISWHHSHEMREFGDHALFVNGHHASPLLLAEWPGKSAYLGSRYPWHSEKEPPNLIQVGPTVTNTAHAFALTLGVSQIVLAGVDLCFTKEGYTHASGSLERASNRPAIGAPTVTPTNDGGTAETNYALMQAADALSAVAGKYQDRCLTINPAPGAAKLDHVVHLPLESVELPVEDVSTATRWRNIIVSHTSRPLVDHYRDQMAEVRRVRKEIYAIRKLAQQALRENKKVLPGKTAEIDERQKGIVDSLEHKIDTRYPHTAEFIKRFGLHRFIDIVRPDGAHQWSPTEIKDAGKVYYTAYIDTCSDLLKLMERSLERLEARIEEEKSAPDIDVLVSQWRRDRQFGRGRSWMSNHREAAKSLGHSDCFESLEKERNLFLTEQRNAVIKLAQSRRQTHLEEKIPSLAFEYFVNRDTDRLQRLSETLRMQESDRAKQLTPLVTGYALELEADFDGALAQYHAVSGDLRFDALKRILSISMANEDYDEALTTLNELSRLSPSFIPLYADLLRLTGDTDKAAELLTDHLLEHPEDLGAMMKLGKIYFQSGAEDGVEWTMHYILEREPTNQEAQQMLAAVMKD